MRKKFKQKLPSTNGNYANDFLCKREISKSVCKRSQKLNRTKVTQAATASKGPEAQSTLVISEPSLPFRQAVTQGGEPGKNARRPCAQVRRAGDRGTRLASDTFLPFGLIHSGTEHVCGFFLPRAQPPKPPSPSEVTKGVPPFPSCSYW